MDNPNVPPAGQSGIQVRTKFFFLMFLLFFFKTQVEVDGGPPVERPWGETFVPVAPGHHTVRCYVPYLFLREMGASTVEVDVAPDQVVAVRWRAPFFVLMAGKWTVEGPVQAT